MSKPTLIQSLLNQPSQSYLQPPKHNYHSTKQDMLRVAAAANANTQHNRRSAHRYDFEELEPSEDSDLEDLFFTPNTSPRTSMASSLVFPTARKPSRKSLRLSDSSDLTRPLTPVGPTTAQSLAVPATRTPSHHLSTQNRHKNQRTPHAFSATSSISTTSLQAHSTISDDRSPTHVTHVMMPPTTHQPDPDVKRNGKEGTTKHTRHGSVTIKPVPSTTTQITQSVKSTTTSKRRTSQQGVTSDDPTKDVKRSASPPSSSPPTTSVSPIPNGSAIISPPVKATANTTPTAIGNPHVLTSRKPSKSQASANPTATSSKEKTKQDVVVEPEVYKSKEKEKELDSSTPFSSKSRIKEKGKEKAKTMPLPTQISAPIPKTTSHTFSAFAPLPAPSSPSPTNGNGNVNSRPSLPPVGFSFPPPPPHSPHQQQSQHPQFQPQQPPKNSLNGSAAAYTYAHRQKNNSSPKLGAGGGTLSLMMNMAALLEEDEADVAADGNTPTRKLRRTANGSGQTKGKEKSKSFDSTSSSSGSSGRSFAGSPSHSTPTSHPTSNSNSYTRSQSQSRSEASTFRNPPKTLSSEINAMTLPTPGDLPSKGTQGYTSLVLPRAPQPLGPHSTGASTLGSGSQRKWFGMKEGKIDLTRSGVAQTTMASVEVVRGLGRQQGQNGFGGVLLGMFGRKRSISSGSVGPRPIEGLGKSVDDARAVNEEHNSKGRAPITAGIEGTVLGFTSYRKPPGHVPSNSVLVQVWAVGVDGVDGRLVGVKFGDLVWGTTGGYEEEDRGAETEWEVQGDDEVDVSRTTPQQQKPNKGSSGLGRSFSLMSRTKRRGSATGAGDVNAKQQPNQQLASGPSQTTQQKQQNPSRAFSLKRNNSIQTSQSQQQSQNTLTKSSSQKQAQRQKVLQKRLPYAKHRAEVGYIPGRSFVGRVLECGWDVKDEVVRKGEWVVGLLDVKKGGALTQFIVVDRHKICRVPHPRKIPQEANGMAMEAEGSLPFQDDDTNMSVLTLEELALLPLCGIPAYRAVRTFIYAFSSLREGGMASPMTASGGVEFGSMNSSKKAMTEHLQDRRRRALVLRGHEGVGAMAVQILARRGWKVSVHVPFSSSSIYEPSTEEHDRLSRNIQDRARDWGADEIIFDEEAGEGIDDGRAAAIRVIESLREDGDVFDAILDTVGGKEVREAGERLLRCAGVLPATPGANGVFAGNEPRATATSKAKGMSQFTTVVGDVPERPIPTAADNFRAGLRSLSGTAGNGDEGATDIKGNRVGYAWVSVAQDVDWEGEDIGDTLGLVLQLALEDGVRPVIHRVVPFERAPYVFVDRGPLGHGCNVVVKTVG